MPAKPKKYSRANPARILVVDDHPVVRYGIARIINRERTMKVCGEAEDDAETLQMIEKARPDIVLLDISLKDADGLRVTKMIKSAYPDLPVLILSVHDEKLYGRRALRSGARGYVTKQESTDKLITAIREVLAGNIWINDKVEKSIVRVYAGMADKRDQSIVDALSDREREVFILVGQGHSARDIADKLSLSVKTIETHRARIKQKLGVPTSQKLTAMAAEWLRTEGFTPAPA